MKAKKEITFEPDRLKYLIHELERLVQRSKHFHGSYRSALERVKFAEEKIKENQERIIKYKKNAYKFNVEYLEAMKQIRILKRKITKARTDPPKEEQKNYDKEKVQENFMDSFRV